MRPEQSPFPCRWESFDLERVLGPIRKRMGTYGRYDYFSLAPLAWEFSGDWNWLLQSAPVRYPISEDRGVEGVAQFPVLAEAAEAAGRQLPATMVRFLSRPELPCRVRSNTDCYLDIRCGLSLVEKTGGHLARFLSDSQGCLFWYVYLPPDGEDHAVVSSPDFYGARFEEEGYYGGRWSSGIPERELENLSFAAGSFEEFMCRFWIENEIWFAGFEKREIPEAGRKYLESYRLSAAGRR